MKLVDTNPKTQQLTEALKSMKWRAIYDDGTYIEQESGKDQYSKIDRSRLVAMAILNIDGTEALKIDVPKGKIGIYRQRTIGNLKGVEVIKILGLIDKSDHSNQVLHYLFRDGHTEVIDEPDEFAKYGKIQNLRDDEVI